MRRKWARIEHRSDGLHFFSSYDRYLVQCLKGNINASERAWNPDKKCWIVDSRHLDELQRITKIALNVTATVRGTPIQGQNATTQKLFRIEYIGGLKDRGSGETSAFGAINKGKPQSYTYTFVDFSIPAGQPNYDLEWSIIFPESTLKDWFNGNSQKQPANVSTLYGVLAVKQSASQQEVKRAWRQMMKRYHPDVNADEDAAAMTIKINEAYSTLRNPQQRRKYDAGLMLAASLQDRTKQPVYSDWQIPIRCGNILCEGQYKVGRFVVSKILQWVDIVENGKMLVTSWDSGTNSLVRNWI